MVQQNPDMRVQGAMKRLYVPLLAILITGAIAACEKRDPVADEAESIPAPTPNDSAGTIAG